ncbi:MAG: aminoacyl-histidine dipeptidase, partial [Clostridia bacterium]|nr:aminoacyl-histidine dipeptidase [Clostridia bacterium]
MRILEGLKPERVFYYFEDLCAIPHGSGNTKQISDYCVAFAKARGLAVYQDAHNNVVIRKPASTGYEDHETVILQGHLDMVCEKEPTSPINFMTDGLTLKREGDLVFAEGTTLGGDDGIAIAMALAVLEDTTLAHPPIEALFTTDEETGMYGAEGLDASVLSGKTLLNIDSEEEGILTVSCAGGARAGITIPLSTDEVHMPCHTVTLTGLIGGHSGVEIDKGRQNSHVLMGQFLHTLPFSYQIIDICGGQKDNAIPRQTVAIVAASGDLATAAAEFVKANRIETEPDLAITVESTANCAIGFDMASSKRIAEFLATVVNGVQSMSKDIANLVQTSLNLGILKAENNLLTATFAVRSSVESEKTALLETLKATAKAYDGVFESHGHYPAWEYRKDSPLRDTMVEVYKKLYGNAPEVVAIHAGLECGLFAGKIPDLDAVSFGPNLYDIHTTRERL